MVTPDKCVTCDKCSCDCDTRCNLHAYNWLADIPGNATETEYVEVHFKNTRKGFYRNSSHLPLKEGDMVAVEANPGHDIGRVSMTGSLVKLQMKKANLKPDVEILRVFRKAKPADLERFEQAKAREGDTMIRSRKIAADLNLKMKIGDVEYQGDGNKAIFYYIADERVDFRQLIKDLAATFHVRIEMKQIGARQEAGRIGGTGPCGRELCCATWMKNFVSVSTNAARFQDISLNPQKLAGMCAKLKCCLNYEVDDYIEANKKLPARDIVLQTLDSDYFFFKSDALAQLVSYTTEKGNPANMETISVRRAWEIIEMNKAGEKPLSLLDDHAQRQPERPVDLLAGESITRFDRSKKKKKKKSGKPQGAKAQAEGKQGRQPSAPQQERQPSAPQQGRQPSAPQQGRQPSAKQPSGQQGKPKTQAPRQPKPKSTDK